MKIEIISLLMIIPILIIAYFISRSVTRASHCGWREPTIKSKNIKTS